AQIGLNTSALPYFFWSYFVTYPVSLSWTSSGAGGTPTPSALYVFNQSAQMWQQFIQGVGANYTNNGNKLALDMAHTCEQTIMSSMFGGQALANCCSTATPVFNAYGACFSLNLGSLVKQGNVQELPGIMTKI